MATRFAVTTLAWVSTAPRGITSTAAVEMTANGSSAATSTAGAAARSAYNPDSGRKPSAGGSPNWYQWATPGLLTAQPVATDAVEASTTIMRGAARSTTRSTSSAVSRQLMG